MEMLNRFSFRRNKSELPADRKKDDVAEVGKMLEAALVHRRFSLEEVSGSGDECSSEGEEWVRSAGFSLAIPVGSCMQLDEYDAKMVKSRNVSRNPSLSMPVVAAAQSVSSSLSPPPSPAITPSSSPVMCSVECQTEPKISMEHEVAMLREQVKRLKLEQHAMEVYYSNKDSVIEKQRATIARMHDEAMRLKEEVFTVKSSEVEEEKEEAPQGSPNSGISSDDDEYHTDASDSEEDEAYSRLEVRRPVKPLIPPVQIEKASPMQRVPSSSNHGMAFGMIHY